MRLFRFIAVWVVLALVAPATAADALKGVALVVGESKYTGLPALTNPKSDARSLDELLGDLGFDVTRVLDADGDKLKDEIAGFETDAKDADVALVYYSGHGIELGGENYLVPVDADLATPQTAGASLIAVSAMLDELAKTVPVTIVLLDACRTNGFPPGTLIQLPGADQPMPATENGLAAIRGPTPVAKAGVAPDSLGMVIGFAASPGQPALDGDPGDPNSPYAAALLRHLTAGGYSFGDVMTMVGEEVYLKTKARQLPWVNSSLRRVLTFGAPVENADPDETAIRTGRRDLLLAIASEPQETRATVESIAAAQDVPLDALYGMLKVLGVDTQSGDLQKQLEEGARQLKAFKEQELGQASSDTELARLTDLANRAQDEGAMALALKYREQATARARELSDERDKLEAGLKQDRIEIARTFAEHAQTASLNFDYKTAAEMFGEAFSEVERWDDELALSYKWLQAGALRDFGDFGADNAALEQSILAYADALKLAPRETKPGQWSSIENDLGWALDTLGERQSDGARLQQAIDTLQASIDGSPPDTPPADLAINRLNLGNALSALGQRGSDTRRMLQAVEVYQAALAGLSRTADAQTWRMLQYNLAGTLKALGERDDSSGYLEQSIATFEAAIDDDLRRLSPTDWGLAQNNYATALYALAERTHDLGLLEKARQALQRSLEVRTIDRFPLDWAMSTSNLGNVLVAIGNETQDVEALKAGIEAYRSALPQLTMDKVPLLWATAQSNMGVALTQLSERTRDRTLLPDAVAAFRNALKWRTQQNDPPAWAMTQLNLAGALQELGSDEVSPEHLNQAAEAARSAVTEWAAEGSLFNWAKANYALGNVLLSLGDREQGTASYQQALPAFENALTQFNKTTTTAEWLATMTNYGLALEDIGERDEKPERLEAAIKAYREALTIVSVQSRPAEFGRLNFNVALCLENIQAFGGPIEKLDEAIATFRLALTGYTRERFPSDWADTQYRLGFALHSRGAKDDGTADQVREAIASYLMAQEVRTKDADPFGWAEVENYLGTAHGLLGTKLGDKATVQQGRDEIAASWAIYKSRDNNYDADFEQRLAVFDKAIAEMS